MTNCECGCGGSTASEFLPGHDQKLRIDLERRVGGLLALRSVVVAAEMHLRGDKSADALADHIRTVLSTRQDEARRS